MGGNALKTVITTRKSVGIYKRIKAYVLETLEKELGLTGINWLVPHEAPEKETFGDLDVLITRQSGFDIRQWILDTFKPDELVSNGGVYSFNIPGVIPMPDCSYGECDSDCQWPSSECELHYSMDDFGKTIPSPAKDFQIDFITTPPEQFTIHHFFLSYGDCGMLIGQIAHSIGLRFGQQGLFVGISENPNVKDDLILSTDPAKICEFLGLDYSMWRRGFVSETEIFHWLSQSPYIHLVEFNRSRRAREMYLRFVDYVKEALEPTKRKPTVPTLDAIITYFGKQSEFAAIQQKQADHQRRSEKFGAHLFSALGDLPGKQLGQIIGGFKRTIPGDFKEWVLATDEPEIQQKVTEYITEAGLIPL